MAGPIAWAQLRPAEAAPGPTQLAAQNRALRQQLAIALEMLRVMHDELTRAQAELAGARS